MEKSNLEQSVIKTIKQAEDLVGFAGLRGFMARLILSEFDDNSPNFRTDLLHLIYARGLSVLFDNVYIYDDDIIEFWGIYKDEILEIVTENLNELSMSPDDLNGWDDSDPFLVGVKNRQVLIRFALDYMFEVEYI